MTDERPSVEPAERGPLAVTTDERSARASWSSTIYAVPIATLLIGLWLIASAGLLDYAKPGVPVICGAAIALLSLVWLLGPTRSRTLALLMAAAGFLTALAAFTTSDPPGETANLALLGLGTAILGIVSIAAGAEERRDSLS